MGGGGAHGGNLRRLPKKPKVDAVRNDINVTPLVDVCLVLLIIFMVITPMLARGKEVPLPETSFHADKRDYLQPVISIGKSQQTGDVLVWLAGMDTQGKQELNEKGLLSTLVKDDASGHHEMTDDLVKEIRRYWDIAQKPDAQGKLFLKVEKEIEYERIYPVLMLLNENETLWAPPYDEKKGNLELATGERMGS